MESPQLRSLISSTNFLKPILSQNTQIIAKKFDLPPRAGYDGVITVSNFVIKR